MTEKNDAEKLIFECCQGDVEAMALLKKTYPELYAKELAKRDPHTKIMVQLISEFASYFNKDLFMIKISILEKASALRAELAAKSPLEKLLVERIIVCWTESYLLDLCVSATADAKLRAFHLKRQISAHRRYVSSIKALAQVRKLELPTIQVNIAEKKVNSAKFKGSRQK